MRRLRLRRGYTIATLAEAVGYARSTVYAWEDGWGRPGDEALMRLAALLDTDPAELDASKPLPKWRGRTKPKRDSVDDQADDENTPASAAAGAA